MQARSMYVSCSLITLFLNKKQIKNVYRSTVFFFLHENAGILIFVYENIYSYSTGCMKIAIRGSRLSLLRRLKTVVTLLRYTLRYRPCRYSVQRRPYSTVWNLNCARLFEFSKTSAEFSNRTQTAVTTCLALNPSLAVSLRPSFSLFH